MGFEDATAVSPVGGGRYTATVHDGWSIGGNANGGYLIAMAARAMCDAVERPDPVTLTAHYLRPVQPGPVTVDVETVRSGRTFSVARATLTGDEALLSLLGTFGDLEGRDGTGIALTGAGPPDLPPIDECVRIEPTDGFPPPLMAHIDLRLHPDDAGFASGTRSGDPRVRGWFAFPGGDAATSAIDSLGVLLAADGFPPAIFNTDLPVGWVPTVELTVHVRARAAPGPLRCAFTSRFVAGGFLEEDGELWDGDGRLVAQSRQLALVPRAG